MTKKKKGTAQGGADAGAVNGSSTPAPQPCPSLSTAESSSSTQLAIPKPSAKGKRPATQQPPQNSPPALIICRNKCAPILSQSRLRIAKFLFTNVDQAGRGRANSRSPGIGATFPPFTVPGSSCRPRSSRPSPTSTTTPLDRAPLTPPSSTISSRSAASSTMPQTSRSAPPRASSRSTHPACPAGTITHMH